MRIVIAAVGRLGPGPERALFERYAARLSPPPVVREVVVGAQAAPDKRRRLEAQALLAAVPKGVRLIACDECGRDLPSEAFARLLGEWRDGGTADVAVVIGGADGLDDGVRAAADLVLRLGAMTWPHLLVRALVAEQLYRAQSILAGHPYHRA